MRSGQRGCRGEMHERCGIKFWVLGRVTVVRHVLEMDYMFMPLLTGVTEGSRRIRKALLPFAVGSPHSPHRIFCASSWQPSSYNGIRALGLLGLCASSVLGL